MFEGRDTNVDKSTDDASETNDILASTSAIIKDPTLHGNKELFLLHSKEFQKAVRTVRSDKEGKSEWEKWFQFIQMQLNNQLHKSSRFLDSFNDGSFQPRLALFGPGIESPRTKHLVHRMVQAHNSSFNAIDFVAGLPGKVRCLILFIRDRNKFDIIWRGFYIMIQKTRNLHLNFRWLWFRSKD